MSSSSTRRSDSCLHGFVWSTSCIIEPLAATDVRGFRHRERHVLCPTALLLGVMFGAVLRGLHENPGHSQVNSTLHLSFCLLLIMTFCGWQLSGRIPQGILPQKGTAARRGLGVLSVKG